MTDTNARVACSEQVQNVLGAIKDDRDNDLLDVIIFCFENVFDWLSLDDLAALSATCKQLQQMTGEFFQREYRMRFARITGDDQRIRYLPQKKFVQRFGINSRCVIIEPNVERLRYMATDHNQQLDMIAFWHGEITKKETNMIATVVKSVKIVEFLNAKFDGEFYDIVLKYCKNMKHLLIKHKLTECMVYGVTNQWQLQKYATLEHLCWDGFKLPDNLEIFFRQNPNVRSLQTGNFIFSETLVLLLETGISLNDLYLELTNFLIPDDLLDQYVSSLNTLYERKQFKNLMMRFTTLSALDNPQWARLQYLNGICCEIPDQESTEAIESLHLKLLILGNKRTLISLSKAESLSKKLSNLEELYLRINSIDQIAPFICNSVKLHEIYVYKVDKALETIQVSSLDEQRMHLQGACKVKVYLPDHAYVQMKWTSKQMHGKLIEIKRTESHAPKHPFVINILRSYIIDEREYRP